jgi:MFS family permease
MRGKYRYFLMTMIIFITMINYVDRSIMAYAQKFIIEEYGLDAQSWGNVLGFFGYGYIFGGFFGGLLADKKGPKFVWILSAATWSVFAVGMGFAGDIGIAIFSGSALAGFAVFRVLFGLAEGPALVGNARTLTNWAPPKERGFLNGLGIFGVPFGALITAPIAAILISTFGWKRCLSY